MRKDKRQMGRSFHLDKMRPLKETEFSFENVSAMFLFFYKVSLSLSLAEPLRLPSASQ